MASVEPTIEQQPQSIQNVLAIPGEHGPVTIRHMTKDDAEFVGYSLVECFRDKYEWSVGKQNIDKMKIYLSKIFGVGSDGMYERIFIASYNGERAGICGIKLHGDKDPEVDEMPDFGCCGTIGWLCMECMIGDTSVPKNTAAVDYIAVDSAFRGKGVGRILLERADYEARQNNCNSVFLWVAYTNRAIHLYERQGYKIVQDKSCCCFAKCTTGVKKFYKMDKEL